MIANSLIGAFSVAVGGFLAVPIADEVPGATPDCFCKAEGKHTSSTNFVGLDVPDDSTNGGCIYNQAEPPVCNIPTKNCQWYAKIAFSAPSGVRYYRTTGGSGGVSYGGSSVGVGATGCTAVTTDAQGNTVAAAELIVTCGLKADNTVYFFNTKSDCNGQGAAAGAGSVGWVKITLTCGNCGGVSDTQD